MAIESEIERWGDDLFDEMASNSNDTTSNKKISLSMCWQGFWNFIKFIRFYIAVFILLCFGAYGGYKCGLRYITGSWTGDLGITYDEDADYCEYADEDLLLWPQIDPWIIDPPVENEPPEKEMQEEDPPVENASPEKEIKEPPPTENQQKINEDFDDFIKLVNRVKGAKEKTPICPPSTRTIHIILLIVGGITTLVLFFLAIKDINIGKESPFYKNSPLRFNTKYKIPWGKLFCGGIFLSVVIGVSSSVYPGCSNTDLVDLDTENPQQDKQFLKRQHKHTKNKKKKKKLKKNIN